MEAPGNPLEKAARLTRDDVALASPNRDSCSECFLGWSALPPRIEGTERVRASRMSRDSASQKDWLPR